MGHRTATSPKHMFWRVQPTFWGGVERGNVDHDVIWGFFVRIYDIYPEADEGLPGRMRVLERRTATSAKHTFWRVQSALWDGV